MSDSMDPNVGIVLPAADLGRERGRGGSEQEQLLLILLLKSSEQFMYSDPSLSSLSLASKPTFPSSVPLMVS